MGHVKELALPRRWQQKAPRLSQNVSQTTVRTSVASGRGFRVTLLSRERDKTQAALLSSDESNHRKTHFCVNVPVSSVSGVLGATHEDWAFLGNLAHVDGHCHCFDGRTRTYQWFVETSDTEVRTLVLELRSLGHSGLYCFLLSLNSVRPQI